MSQLFLSDYQKLLDLFEGRLPQWTAPALKRCEEAGLIEQRGDVLTLAGRRKAARIQEAMTLLRNGVPLDTPRTDRRCELKHEEWQRTKFDDNPCWFNEHAIFSGRPPEDITAAKISSEAETFRWLKREITKAADAQNWIRIQPLIIQRNTLEGLEIVCFAGAKFGRTRTIVRIQTRYFDYVMAEWPDAVWWVLPRDKADPLVMARASGKDLIVRGVAAVIQPVKTSGWLETDIECLMQSSSSVKGEGICQRDDETKRIRVSQRDSIQGHKRARKQHRKILKRSQSASITA